MKVLEIRSEAELQAMKAAWNELLCRSAADTIFLTWEWITAWWSAYGRAGDLRILAAVEHDGTLVGVAPLRAQMLRRYGQTVRAVSFIGDGSYDSDYLDFIVTRGREREVFELFRPCLAQLVKRSDVLLLNEVPAASASLQYLKTLAGVSHCEWTESDVSCGMFHLPHTWEEYMRVLKPRFRTKVRSVLRNLEARPEVSFRVCTTCEEVEQMLPVLFDLHTRRWAQDGKPGVYRSDEKRTFYSVLSTVLMKRNWLRVSALEWNGRAIACEYGFVYNSTYFHLQEGYEPAAEHWSIGIGLRAWTIQKFIEEGLTTYDFLGGVGRHKTDWGAGKKLSKRVQIAALSHKNVLFCRGPQWELRARELVKKIVPDALVRARQEGRGRAMSGAGPSPGPARKEPAIRRMAANCYFHMGMPKLVQTIREGHEMSVARDGKWPKISWRARTAPAARILYYHRVNDSRDPFCPALPTHLFEQQMRFLSRHYRVVGLAGLLEHLQSDSPANVVAITFDDGYEDNYVNAFPILEKYGIPATIFITTGSVDSREPLWFERLALAVKNTSKDFVDIEIDAPRRFWLRNEAERLLANGEIFRLLRMLSDSERRTWLDRILRQIGVRGDGSPHAGMLTWEQIRRMRAGRITFGAHTVTHPFVSKLTQEQMVWEVSECKRRIEEEVQSPVEYFAYPNGRGEDFAVWNKEALRAAGYRAAVTTIWGLNYGSTDPMELRRGQPWEENPAAFACKFDWYELTNN